MIDLRDVSKTYGEGKNSVTALRATISVLLLATGLSACQPYDPPEQPEGSSASCCGGAGICIPSGFAPSGREGQLDRDACEEDLVCAPRSWLLDPAGPARCRAPGDLEGRCLSLCLPQVAEQADQLDQRGCNRDERCVPCYDPLTGKDTEACQGSDDEPAEEPRTYQRCCGGPGSELGTCVPSSLLSAEQVDTLPVDSCRLPGTRCVPSQPLDGSEELAQCASRSAQ